MAVSIEKTEDPTVFRVVQTVSTDDLGKDYDAVDVYQNGFQQLRKKVNLESQRKNAPKQIAELQKLPPVESLPQ